MKCEFLSSLLGKDVRCEFVRLGSRVVGAIYLSKKGRYHILINKDITFERQREAFLHEAKHLITDLPPGVYIVGMDIQYHKIERDADLIAFKVAESLSKYETD